MTTTKKKAEFDALLAKADAAGAKNAAEHLATLQGQGAAYAVVQDTDEGKKVVGTMLDVRGFATVTVENARKAFLQYARKIGRARNGFYGGMCFSVHAQVKGKYRQEMSVQSAYAKGMAVVFREAGYRVSVQTRID